MKLSERIILAHVAFLRRSKTFRAAAIETGVGFLMIVISSVAVLTGAEFLMVTHYVLSWLFVLMLALSAINWEADTFDRENVFGVPAIVFFAAFYIAVNAPTKPVVAGLTVFFLFVYVVAGLIHLLNQPPMEIPMEMKEVEMVEADEATIRDRAERSDRTPGGIGQ